MKEIKMNDGPIGYKRAGELLDAMPDFEIARWQSLMDAVEMVHEKCVDRKMDFNKLDIKPLAINKFIESTCDIYARNIERQRAHEKLVKQNSAQSIVPKLMNEINKNELFKTL